MRSLAMGKDGRKGGTSGVDTRPSDSNVSIVGITMNIQDIKNSLYAEEGDHAEPQGSARSTHGAGSLPSATHQSTSSFLDQSKDPRNDKPIERSVSYFGVRDQAQYQGMTKEAFCTYKDVYERSTLTHRDFGVNERHTLIVPSFGTTSKIFAQHLSILRELK